jgi:hypothetical protein
VNVYYNGVKFYQSIRTETGTVPNDVTFDRATQRFQIDHAGEYVSPDTPEERGDNPTLTIGKCSAF